MATAKKNTARKQLSEYDRLRLGNPDGLSRRERGVPVLTEIRLVSEDPNVEEKIFDFDENQYGTYISLTYKWQSPGQPHLPWVSDEGSVLENETKLDFEDLDLFKMYRDAKDARNDRTRVIVEKRSVHILKSKAYKTAPSGLLPEDYAHCKETKEAYRQKHQARLERAMKNQKESAVSNG